MIRIQSEAFDAGEEIARVTNGRADVGGLCAFIGLVRDLTDGKAVTAMTLEHYPDMAERQLERIEADAHQRWPLLETTIIHRYGRLVPSDPIVLVIATSAHRDAAFQACRFLIDWLKTDAPFWKCEDDGETTRWVECRDADVAAAEAWGERKSQDFGR
jgi:molybdopterin synthase catalytic subunit